jgi:hypothetical protein
MDALACENILTRRANHRHHCIIAQFARPPMALPIGLSARLQTKFSSAWTCRLLQFTTNISRTISTQFNIPARIQFFAVFRASKWPLKRRLLARFGFQIIAPSHEVLNGAVCSFVQGVRFCRIRHLLASVHRLLPHAQFNYGAHSIHSVRR